MSLPSVYNTKQGGRQRVAPKQPTKSSTSHTTGPSPYQSSQIDTSSTTTKMTATTKSTVDDYPRAVPSTRLEQLLSTLGRALDSESSLNRGKWVVRDDDNALLGMSNVVPPFVAQTYAPGVFNNVVSRSLSSNEPTPPRPPATDYLYQAAVDLPQDGGPSLEQNIEQDFKQRLAQLEQRHQIYTSRLTDRITNLKSIGSNFDENTDSCISRSTLAHLLYERKCRVQSSVANRRLQELLFECLGEIEKACIRSTLLAETLCENVVVQKNQVASSTLWKEFLMRAEEDAMQQIDLLSIEKKLYTDIHDRCADECREALMSSKYVPEDALIHVKRIVCVRPGFKLPQSRRRSRDTRRRVSRLHHNNQEIAILLASLNKEYAKLDGTNGYSINLFTTGSGKSSKKKNDTKVEDSENGESTMDKIKPKDGAICLRHGETMTRNGSSSSSSSSSSTTSTRTSTTSKRLPLFPSVVPLSTSVIKWLLPATGCHINSNVYYCLEERAEQWKSNQGSNSQSSKSHSYKSKDGSTLSKATYSYVTNILCHVLHDLYDGKGTSGRSHKDYGSVGPMEVVDICSEHRSNPVSKVLDESNLIFDEKMLVSQFLASYPDVVRVKIGNEVKHFGSAFVLNIFETKICSELCKTLDSDSKQSVHASYPEDACLRKGCLKLYHLGHEIKMSKKNHSHQNMDAARKSPLIGAKMFRLGDVPMRELCAMYGVSGDMDYAAEVYGANSTAASASSLQPLPNSMSIFTSDKNERTGKGKGHGDAYNDEEELSYFVLHNPTTRAVQTFLDKQATRSKKSRLARKQDCYGGLVEKERVAAIEYSRNKPIPGSRRNSAKKDSKKDEDDATGSTVPCIALLVGVDLPHRHPKRRKQPSDGGNDGDKPTDQTEKGVVAIPNANNNNIGSAAAAVSSAPKRKRSSSVTNEPIISGLAVGSFCRWRGCLCRGTKIPILSNGKQSKHALCGLHSILRSFLEGCGAKEELARHLPSNKNMKSVLAKNKTTTEIAVEFLRITATSALLQELLGGKLAATIRAFCRRAAADARAQRPDHVKKKTNGNGSPNHRDSKTNGGSGSTAENDQAMHENEKQRTDLTKDVSLSQQVYATESDVAEELRKLCSLGVFPKAELQTIRETYNELDRERIRLLAAKNNQRSGEEEFEPSSSDLKQHTNNKVRTEGELELEFCKRKLAILRGRRQELEISISKGVDITRKNPIYVAAGLTAAASGRSGNGGALDLLASPTSMSALSAATATTLVTHEHMSPTERAIVNAAAREVEKVASEQEAQQSLARARLQDAREFSQKNYSKGTAEELKQKQKQSATQRDGNRRTKPRKKSTAGAAYLGKCFFSSSSSFLIELILNVMI